MLSYKLTTHRQCNHKQLQEDLRQDHKYFQAVDIVFKLETLITGENHGKLTGPYLIAAHTHDKRTSLQDRRDRFLKVFVPIKKVQSEDFMKWPMCMKNDMYWFKRFVKPTPAQYRLSLSQMVLKLKTCTYAMC